MYFPDFRSSQLQALAQQEQVAPSKPQDQPGLGPFDRLFSCCGPARTMHRDTWSMETLVPFSLLLALGIRKRGGEQSPEADVSRGQEAGSRKPATFKLAGETRNTDVE